MQPLINELGQPVGQPVIGWRVPPAARPVTMEHRLCRLEPFDAARHGHALFAAFAEDRRGEAWTYLPYGPFDTEAAFVDWATRSCCDADPLFFTIIDTRTDLAAGLAAYLRIMPSAGSIEVGHLHFAPSLQRRPAATAAMYLMAQHVFGLGYRRYEWKCDALNAPSRRAAERLGFTFEGVFRQAAVVRGRNRDTAWYSVLDKDWPARQAAMQAWLSPSNFDEHGQQLQPLRRPPVRP